MGLVLTDDKHYKAIADSIRNYGVSFSDVTMLPSEMAEKVAVSCTGNYEAGMQEGYNDGWTVGWSEGLDEGYNEGVIIGEDVGYDKGHIDGVFDAAPRGKVIGTVLQLDDISPLEHYVAVRVSGVEEPRAVTVYAGGVNLYDDSAKTVGANISFGKETADANTNLSDYFAVPPNATVQINLGNTWAFYDAEKNLLSYENKSATVPRSIVVPANAFYMRFSYHTAVTGGNTNAANTSDGSNILAVVGTKLPADYYPFTQGLSAYPVNLDGSCHVNSVAPHMTLTTNTTGAVLDCEYAKTPEAAYAEGVQDESDRFWDAIQNSGARKDYRYAFCETGFTHIDPKYPVTATNAENIVGGSKNLVSVNWSKFNLSNVNSLYCAFAFCNKLTAIDTELGIKNSTATLMNSLCRQCKELVSVKKIIASPVFVWKDAFEQCTALEEIRFDGEIGASGLNLQWSTKLSRASIESIVIALSTTTSGLSITLSKTAVDKAFEEPIGDNNGSNSVDWDDLLAKRPNWTINLV